MRRAVTLGRASARRINGKRSVENRTDGRTHEKRAALEGLDDLLHLEWIEQTIVEPSGKGAQ
jgi:hypothetical protein